MDIPRTYQGKIYKGAVKKLTPHTSEGVSLSQ